MVTTSCSHDLVETLSTNGSNLENAQRRCASCGADIGASAANHNRTDHVDSLIAMFDLAAALPNAWITVFEADVPGAEYVARLFASARGYHIDVDVITNVLRVRKSSATFEPAFVSVHRAEAA